MMDAATLQTTSHAATKSLMRYGKAALARALWEVQEGRPVESVVLRLDDYQEQARLDAGRLRADRATAAYQRLLELQRERNDALRAELAARQEGRHDG